jgi:hypothetical protein
MYYTHTPHTQVTRERLRGREGERLRERKREREGGRERERERERERCLSSGAG